MSGLHLTGPLGKFSWRMLATVLGGQGVVVFLGALVARAVASADGDTRSSTWLWVGTGLALACFAGAGLMRRPWGVTFGWVLQGLTLASAVVVPAMLLVGLIFLALWVLCMVQGDHVDRLQAQREAQGAQPAGPADRTGPRAR